MNSVGKIEFPVIKLRFCEFSIIFLTFFSLIDRWLEIIIVRSDEDHYRKVLSWIPLADRTNSVGRVEILAVSLSGISERNKEMTISIFNKSLSTFFTLIDDREYKLRNDKARSSESHFFNDLIKRCSSLQWINFSLHTRSQSCRYRAYRWA